MTVIKGWRKVNGKRRWVQIGFSGGYEFHFQLGWLLPQRVTASYMPDSCTFDEFVETTLAWM
jgi:hypothetical protein